MKLLFVCLGNICRSPAAEAIMKKLLDDSGFKNQFSCDSAGTAAYHKGELADPRMRDTAMKRGYHITSTSRPFDADMDFHDFEYIFVMDESNYNNVVDQSSSPEYRKKVKRITSYCTSHDITEVPDPYHGGTEGFNYVIDILEDACENILKEITSPAEI